jgi:hypothetical protein
MPTTLAIDFGSRYIGIALVQHTEPRRNRVLYAATIVVDAKPLNALVETRAAVRRLRRTRKTHKRRLRRLSQALAGIPNAEAIIRFCRRRGYSHADEGADPETQSFHFHRSVFFQALREEIARVIEPGHQARVLKMCSKHLNELCRREAELRPARFDNRGPTRCNWQGCTRLVPKAENDYKGRLQQALFGWLLPVFEQSADRGRLRRSIDYWIRRLEALSASYRKTAEAASRRPINAAINRVFRSLRARVKHEATHDTAEKFGQDWQEHYRKALSAILRGNQTGRVRYCRQHSEEFVTYRLANKVPPNRVDITEADLVSRKQQIVFRRLWRLVESRLLPLAGGRIDRVVVERVAFDVLAGPFKARQELSQDKASAMYWHGPQLGFTSRLDMLRQEFGGRCAYCGQPGAVEQVEHLLPQSSFPFDSYFNILPACISCNSRKGARTALDAGMTVHDDAYASYCDYVRKRKPPHVYHTMKKGLLNLLRRPSTSGEAERRLAMLANDLVTVAATQRSPRPLARYLAGNLEKRTGQRPAIAYCAGRHTALYRSALLAEYDKDPADLRNHAVDAIVLGCELPSASALENKHWNLGGRAIEDWFAAVKAAAPETLLGLPRVDPVRFVPYFEEDLEGGYCKIDLSSFNWNRGRKATHVLDPFGVTASDKPLKRKPAAKVLAKLKEAATRAGEIDQVAHPGLRKLLGQDPEHAAEQLVRWLQQTVRAGLKNAAVGSHPADSARRRLLQKFVDAPAEAVVAGEEPIPPTIGVRCCRTLGSQNKVDVGRVGRDGKVFQHYQADPVVKELYVGYRMNDGQLDRAAPVLFVVNQIFGVKRQSGGRRTWATDVADSPLRGRPHSSREKLTDFLARWQQEFAKLCESERIAKVFRITQGCVIEKADGTQFQMRNFDKGGEWMRAAAFRGIVRVHRSPLRVI